MKRIILSVLLLFVFISGAYAAEQIKTVVIGVGQTQEEALQNALDVAVRQLNLTYIDVLNRSDQKAFAPIAKNDMPTYSATTDNTGAISINAPNKKKLEEFQNTKRNKLEKIGRKAVSRYTVTNEKQENGLVYLTVNVLAERQHTLLFAVANDYKSNIAFDNNMDLATFGQERKKSAKLIISAMIDPESMASTGYQFIAAGQPKIEEVLADHIRGYIPVWIGRNSTFWHEYFDVLTRLGSKKSDIEHGWYSSHNESALIESKGGNALPFDIAEHRLAKNVKSVKISSDIAGMLAPTILTVTIPGSTESIELFVDRNLIIAGYDESNLPASTIVADNDINPIVWFLAQDWLEIAENKNVLSAPIGTPLYIAPDSVHIKGANIRDDSFMSYAGIYGGTERSDNGGRELIRERRNRYSRWGNDLAVATTGQGFIVKVPFSVENPQALQKNKDMLEISARSGVKQPGGSKAKVQVTFKQAI